MSIHTSTSTSTLTLLQWTARLAAIAAATKGAAAATWPALLDIPMVAALDLAALVATQVHRDFLAPHGTAPPAAAAGGEHGNGNGDAEAAAAMEPAEEEEDEDEEGEERGDEDREEASGVKVEESAASVASSSRQQQKKGKSGGSGGRRQFPPARGAPELRALVNTSALPEGSHDLLPYTVYSRLAGLLGGWPGLSISEGNGAGDAPAAAAAAAAAAHHHHHHHHRPPPVWQALHALHAHVADRCLGPAPHMRQAAGAAQRLARHHLMASYIDRSLARLLALHRGQPGVSSLSLHDRQTAWAMARWLGARRAFFEEAGRPLRRLRRAGEDGSWGDLAAAALQICGSVGGERGAADLLWVGVVRDWILAWLCADGHPPPPHTHTPQYNTEWRRAAGPTRRPGWLKSCRSSASSATAPSPRAA